MRRRSPTALAGAAICLVVGAATLAGCGGKDGSAASGSDLSTKEKQAAAQIAQYVTTQSGGLVDEKGARCFANTFIGKAGLSKLHKAKLLKADNTVNSATATFDEPLATTYVDSYFGCLNYADLESAFLVKSDASLDKSTLRKCIGESIKESDAKQLVVNSLTGNSDQKLTQSNEQAMTKCQLLAKKGSAK